MPNISIVSKNIINRANAFRDKSRILDIAIGGTIVTDANYTYHVYTATGTFFTPNDRDADALIIAGGGSGGLQRAGGGGGGGVIFYRTLRFAGQTSYTVTVGSGGIGTSNTSGGLSSVVHRDGTLQADGGGRGSQSYGATGTNGGSGGGGSGGSYGGGANQTGNAMGWDGAFGSSNSNYSWRGGGGGGATSNGVTGENSNGNGGNGFLLDTVTRALAAFAGMTYVSSGGGAGSYNGSPGSASTAGGGNGSANSTGGAATSYGSGGGGGGLDGNYGGNGYQGIVVLRYPR